MEPGEPTFNMGRNDTIADNATLFFRSITAVITAGFAAGADDVAVTNKRTPPPLLAEQQQAEAALRHASKVAKKLKRKKHDHGGARRVQPPATTIQGGDAQTGSTRRGGRWCTKMYQVWIPHAPRLLPRLWTSGVLN